MHHIGDIMTSAFESWQYYRSRWAFYRQYYPEHAEQWIAEDKASVTGRRAADEFGAFPVSSSRPVRPLTRR